MVRNGCGQSSHRTLKLTVSQKWIDGMNWLFACWCKFRKAKSYFTDFWVGLVKNGCGHLVHETPKSVEWVYELSWFFACWLWCNNFWLDKHRNLYVWLLNAGLLQLYLLVPWQLLEESFEIGCDHPFVLPYEVCSWNWIIRFLWILTWCWRPLMLSANQITEFLNQVFLQSKWMKQPHFSMLIQ